ncbi:unnamed protein product [Eretmochelys imbricata]
MLPKAVVTNGHTEHSTTAANEPNVPPEKWQQKRVFCKGKSCLTNLLEFFETVNKYMDKGDPVDIVNLDFQKAFDKVAHQRLILSKVSSHGPICAPRQHFPSRPDDYIMSLNGSYEGLCHRLLESSHRYSDQLLFNYSVTEVKRFTTPQELMSFLQSFNAQLWNQSLEEPHALNATEFTFTATVIACCFYSDPQGGTDLHHFYGASLSCKGLHERRIMIELSSIKTWHKAMAYAVHHGDTGLAITFPEGVWSQAFQFNVEEQKYQEKSPCGKCQQMFRNVNFWPPPNTPATGDKWQYGNCTEVESLSKLLLGTRVVEERVRSTRTPPLPNSYEAIERDFTNSIEEDIKKSLINRLLSRQFKAKTLQFFNLQ